LVLVDGMSIHLRRMVTAARLAANRRSALKSTGPRTAAGKRRSSLNALRGGGRSTTFDLFWQVEMTAPPCALSQTAARMMTPEQRSHPRIAFLLESFGSDQDLEADALTHRKTTGIKSKK